MVKVTMHTNGENGATTDFEISNMETLAKFQAMLTEEVIKGIQAELTEEQREDIIHNYIQEADSDFTMRCNLVEEIENGATNIWDEIIERALRDTDYSTIDEMTDAIECRDNALYEIYNIAREYV